MLKPNAIMNRAKYVLNSLFFILKNILNFKDSQNYFVSIFVYFIFYYFIIIVINPLINKMNINL